MRTGSATDGATQQGIVAPTEKRTGEMKTKARCVPLDEYVSYRFSLIVKRIDLALAAVHAKKLAISITNWKIMRVIGFFGPLSASELGARTNLDPDKITRAVDTLVQRSYVIRKHDEADRRRVVLTLSAKGRRVYEKIEDVANEMEVELLSVLTAEERKALLSSLSKLEQHSSTILGRREGYERRHLAGAASRAPTQGAGRTKRTEKAVTRKLATAE
jgi:DNA-binding MarR family transcriptional regulator